MKIKINYLGGSNEWRDKIRKSANIVERLFDNTTFLDAVAREPIYHFTKKTPEQVAMTIVDAREITIFVGFYSNFFTRAIAYEKNGRIFFNTRKAAAGEWPNVMHECLHVLGFQHNGNAQKGNELSVPYRVPEIAERYLKII
jgi:hypothetical protein